MQETATKLLDDKLPSFSGKFANAVVDATDYRGDLTIVVKAESIREMVAFLKAECQPRFEMLLDIFALDYLKLSTEMPERFAVVYNFYSLSGKRRVRLKVFLPEQDPTIDSIHDLYASANWFEREAWDLFGIRFQNHPNLVRILCHSEFEGHPLRKDYPSDQYQQLKKPAPSTGF